MGTVIYCAVHICVHGIVEHPNQEGDTALHCDHNRTSEPTAEQVYGGHMQSTGTDRWAPLSVSGGRVGG